jgi:hypothetical protein
VLVKQKHKPNAHLGGKGLILSGHAERMILSAHTETNILSAWAALRV